MSDDTTILTNIREALASTEKEASQGPAALLVVGGDLNGALFNLAEPEVTVGRDADNNIVLEFHGISRHHFQVKQKGDKHTVEDLGSKNGTYLNNKLLEGAIVLNKGDIIKLGNMALKYLPKGDPERLTYDKLHLQANTDRHTGCYNKTYFNNSISLEVKKSKITGEPLSLILFDLDHFKKLNDNFGHDAGDFVLKQLAELIRKQGSREKDVFARYGGEEFVVILPKTNLKQAYEIAERIRRLIEEFAFIYEAKRLPVTISVGIADYRDGVNDGAELFKRADKALYSSKSGGRNQVQFYRQ